MKFDDYSLEWFQLDNSIMQGDPLSMILYLFYNADLLDIGCGRHEICLGYVDDLALVAMAGNFTDTHRLLNSMITWPEGAGDWSTSHNSKFEASKLVLLDFSCAKNVSRPPMLLQGCTINPQTSHKFLGVMIDQELRWRQQPDYTLAKATKWTLSFQRLARPAMGISLQLQLFA